MDKEADDIIKNSVLRFLGEDPHVRQEFLRDTSFSIPIYVAPDIILWIVDNSYWISQLLYSVFASLFAAYLFHRLIYKREAQEFQKELELKMREILKEYQTQTRILLKANEDLRKKFRRVDLRKIYIQLKPDMKKKWEIRLEVYSDRMKLLLKSDEAIQLIVKIFDETTQNEPNC